MDYSSYNSLGQKTGVGSLSLLQGIFPTQGLNPGLSHGRKILYPLSHQGSPSGKEPTCNAGDARDAGLISGSGRSPEGGYSNPLQYYCLENPMDRGAWWGAVHRVTQSWTCLKRLSMLASKYLEKQKRPLINVAFFGIGMKT